MKKLLKYCSIILLLVNCIIVLKYVYENYNNESLIKHLKESSLLDSEGVNFTDTIREEFDKMFDKNNDFIGWINIPNTNIDYPVVQTNNNTFYLERDFLKRVNHGGCIFVDYSNNFESNIIDGDKNLIFYGHNLKNGVMFEELTKFKDADFFKSNKTIYFTTKSNRFKFEIFSVYVEKASDYYRKNTFLNDKDYVNFIDSIKNKSIYKNNVSINKDDNIITLSTCSYDFDDARLVVHAKLVNDDE